MERGWMCICTGAWLGEVWKVQTSRTAVIKGRKNKKSNRKILIFCAETFLTYWAK